MNSRYTKWSVALDEAGQAVTHRWQASAAEFNDKNRRAALATSSGNQCDKARLAVPVRFKKLVPAVCGMMLISLSGLVSAGIYFDPETDRYIRRVKVGLDGFRDYPVNFQELARIYRTGVQKPETKAANLAQTPDQIYHNAYQTDNSHFTTDPGEPLVNGMTRTFGRFYMPSRNERVVLNTYGSTRIDGVERVELDTVLAAYRIDFSNGATGFKALKRVAVSDDKKIPGHFSGASLVQFDAIKGERYVIQAGSKKEGGDLLLTGFTFPLAGGLTIQPFSANGGYSYSCDFRPCENVSYIVHNSTAKTLTVTASATGLGGAFTLPKPFTLAPGAAVVKTFTYNPAFDSSAVKTLSGGFSFTGKTGSTVAARITMPARITVHDSPSVEPSLKLTSKPQVLSGATGEVFYVPVGIKNIGGAPAIGCYANNGINSGSGGFFLQTAWAAYDPATQRVTGEPYAPFDIAAGKTVNILVAMRSFHDRLGDFQRPVEISCASASSFPTPGVFDLTNTVDFTNTVTKYPKLTLVKTSPENGILTVSAPGKIFSASFRNDGSDTADVTANVEEWSFNGQTGQDQPFGVAVCKASTTAANCLASTAQELPLSIKPGKTGVVKVAVRYPAEAREFSPNRGVSLLLKHDDDDGGFVFPNAIPLAGTTKALLRKP